MRNAHNLKMTMKSAKLCIIVLIFKSISNCNGNEQGHEFPPDSSCNFNEGICAWKQGDLNEHFKWEREQKHQDWFIYMEASNPHTANTTAWLISPTITYEKVFCFSFRYHMFGIHVNALNVRLRTNKNTTLIWQRTHSQDNVWIRGYRTIKEKPPFQIILEGVAGVATDNTITNGGAIVVDDLLFSHGYCAPSLELSNSVCDFEEHFCKWEITDTKLPWVRKTSIDLSSKKKPHIDHTTRTDNGNFACVATNNDTKKASGRLESFYLEPGSPGSCLQFWYYITKSSNASLTVSLTTGIYRTKLLTKREVEQNDWSFAQVTVNSNHSHKIILEASIDNEYETVVAIDDIHILKEACEDPGFCTFQHGYCGWYNVYENKSNVFWQRSIGGDSVIHEPNMPHFDGTGTDAGYFLFIDISNTKESVEGILSSETIHTCPNHCFMFQYITQGKHFGALHIIIKHAGKEIAFVPVTTPTYDNWSQRNVEISTAHCTIQSFEIIIKAIVGSTNGYVAIDNLYLAEGRCSNFTDEIAVPEDPSLITTAQPHTTISPRPSTSRDKNSTISTFSTHSTKRPIINTNATTKSYIRTTMSSYTTLLPREGCDAGKVSCRDGVTCILALFLCDGIQDCPNNADEDFCNISFVNYCKKNFQNQYWFYCETRYGPQCLQYSRVCNGKSDCLNNADETKHFCGVCPNNYCADDDSQCFVRRTIPQCACYQKIGHVLAKDGHRRCKYVEDKPAPSNNNNNTENVVLLSIPFMAFAIVVLIILSINVYCHHKYRWYQAAGIFQNRNNMYVRNSMSELTDGVTNPLAELEDSDRERSLSTPDDNISSILGSPLADYRNSTIYLGAIVVDEHGNLVSVPRR